jgi:hypothetical protein
MTIGIKVSEKGYDVNTAANKNIVLSTERNCLKLDNVATTTLVATGGGGGTRTIDHGQSFIPVVIAFINIGGNYYFFPFSDSAGDNLGNIKVDATNVVFDCLVADGTHTIYYFLSKTESI